MIRSSCRAPCASDRSRSWATVVARPAPRRSQRPSVGRARVSTTVSAPVTAPAVVRGRTPTCGPRAPATRRAGAHGGHRGPSPPPAFPSGPPARRASAGSGTSTAPCAHRSVPCAAAITSRSLAWSRRSSRTMGTSMARATSARIGPATARGTPTPEPAPRRDTARRAPRPAPPVRGGLGAPRSGGAGSVRAHAARGDRQADVEDGGVHGLTDVIVGARRPAGPGARRIVVLHGSQDHGRPAVLASSDVAAQVRGVRAGGGRGRGQRGQGEAVRERPGPHPRWRSRRPRSRGTAGPGEGDAPRHRPRRPAHAALCPGHGCRRFGRVRCLCAHSRSVGGMRGRLPAGEGVRRLKLRRSARAGPA